MSKIKLTLGQQQRLNDLTLPALVAALLASPFYFALFCSRVRLYQAYQSYPGSKNSYLFWRGSLCVLLHFYCTVHSGSAVAVLSPNDTKLAICAKTACYRAGLLCPVPVLPCLVCPIRSNAVGAIRTGATGAANQS